jgi:signal transduction histidine kinase
VEKPHLEIRLDLSADLPRIQADPSLMKQVFLNLIKNAAEACGPSGTVVIKTGSTAPWMEISFTDNGPGISPELLRRIFEPFFTTKTTGMGVGLAICKRIVEAHQGRIEANNLVPKGTQFSVFLPM